MFFLKKMLTEVVIPMSITEELTNSSWNLLAVNMVSAVDGKNLLNEVGMASTNQELTFLFKYSQNQLTLSFMNASATVI
jgi:hypothetical protein